MLYKELLKLTTEERDIIVCWRILRYPYQPSIEELSRDLRLPTETIINAIKKFNHNCRMKLEAQRREDELRAIIEMVFFDD
jgi:hypothetical protein